MFKYIISAGFLLTFLVFTVSTANAEWSMVANNPQRTSWASEEIKANSVDWYRPIEAYIPQHYQLIAGHGLIYVPTSKGVYALNASSGDTAWRFDTELPIGNSPTLDGSVLYVGGFDHKIHALNATNGNHLWSFDGASKGFNTNPLVIDGKVIAGNRDGYMYAIGAHGASSQGKLIWKYKTGGPILLSAAYNNGVIYFASNDMHAYALNVSNGSLKWKSQKLPGDGFHAYWPVIVKDKVVFSAASGYRMKLDPGTGTFPGGTGTNENIQKVERDDIFFDKVYGDLVGSTTKIGDAWTQGKTVIDITRVSNYLEDNLNSHPNLHKPWRRTLIILNQSNGAEATFDLDNDGHREYAPYAYFSTRSGNRYPPVVGPDGMLYTHNMYKYNSISRAKVMGWNLSSKYMTLEDTEVAIDEPQSLSGSGKYIYGALCCDRVGIRTTYNLPRDNKVLWSYSASGFYVTAPGYDEMWTLNPVYKKIHNRLFGNFGFLNGIYHNHGYQNPMIPYNGKVYIHRSNAVIALDSPGNSRKVPLLNINNVTSSFSAPSRQELKNTLESEINKIVSAGHLRPGHYNQGQSKYLVMADYFSNPGETLYTLALSYPHLSSTLQSKVKTYLKNQFNAYFYPTMYADVGWKDGVGREHTILPPEIQNVLSNHPKRTSVKTDQHTYNFIWSYPQFNFYALWKYSQIVPEDAGKAYAQAKSKIEVPAKGDAARLSEFAWERNAYIAGYIGFLNLQKLAGKDGTDSSLRSQVSNELNKLKSQAINNFQTDSPWWGAALNDGSPDGRNTWRNRSHNVTRNFLWLVPELGDHLNKNAYSKVKSAIDQYSYEGPYWMVSRYEANIGESASQHLFDYPAMFQAKALILKESYGQLSKYLDVSAFARGDLYYIQNIIFTIEAGGTAPTPPPFTPSPIPNVPGDGNGDGIVDGSDFVIWLTHYGQNVSGASNGDYNGSNNVDIADYVVWITNY